MTTLHLVSHTHWDREWYLTYQQFRLKLVHLIDHVLHLLEVDPDFKYFMLDGQTIVLDDYLQIRPEREEEVRRHVQNGRILIGPWFILPDEFLVSPEATVRNLLQGDATAHRFGAKMRVGYIPDPFGHIGQMPQILKGFGIDTASLQRGLADQPVEFWWQAPDGSRVFMSNLREGYGNAAGLPTSDLPGFVAEVMRLKDNLLSHSHQKDETAHLLLMHGTDHMEPPGDTSKAIAYANQHLNGDVVVHSTLPAYLDAVRSVLQEDLHHDGNIPVVVGELRSSKRHPLLPGVLSTRIWIKQRNNACQNLLEKWAEPFSTWASIIVPSSDYVPGEIVRSMKGVRLQNPAPALRHAWRVLMENHPHDSICGCSIDQVHEEMRPRFDQVEQIGEEITRQSLEALGQAIDTSETHDALEDCISSIVVFNPVNGPRTDLVTAQIELPPGIEAFEIIDERGITIPHQVLGSESAELINIELDRNGLQSALGMIHEGQIAGMYVQDVSFQREDSRLKVEAVLTDTSDVDMDIWEEGMKALQHFISDPSITTFIVRARSAAATTSAFVAPQVPGYGYRTFWIREKRNGGSRSSKPVKVATLTTKVLPIVSKLANLSFLQRSTPSRSGQNEVSGLPAFGEISTRAPYVIENEFLMVKASSQDGTVELTDKRSGVKYAGLNCFIDGGDCGDEYNYSPPAHDELVSSAEAIQIRVERNPAYQAVHIWLRLNIPEGLTADRQARSPKKVALPIYTRLALMPGVPRLDVHTKVVNGSSDKALAQDHRLRVHFPAPFVPLDDQAYYDGHFEIVRRPVHLPKFDQSWIEEPRPEQPQRAFVYLEGEETGLTIANRGLPEVEVKTISPTSSEIALTLLRSVGWLSRDDFRTRKGQAGPALATPRAQMPGEYSFDYAIIPENETGNQPMVESWLQAYAFNGPMRATYTSLHPGKLPSDGSLLEVHPQEFIISSIKAAENGHGWIVRGYNVGEEVLPVSFTPWRRFKRVEKVNLAEQIQDELPVTDNGSVTISVRGYEIATLKFCD